MYSGFKAVIFLRQAEQVEKVPPQVAEAALHWLWTGIGYCVSIIFWTCDSHLLCSLNAVMVAALLCLKHLKLLVAHPTPPPRHWPCILGVRQGLQPAYVQ